MENPTGYLELQSCELMLVAYQVPDGAIEFSLPWSQLRTTRAEATILAGRIKAACEWLAETTISKEF